MTELSGSFNARAAGAVPKSPAVPTLIMVVGLALTWVALPSTDSESIFDTAAIGVGVALLAATAVEAARGRSRVDPHRQFDALGVLRTDAARISLSAARCQQQRQHRCCDARHGDRSARLLRIGPGTPSGLDAIESRRAGRFQAGPSVRIVPVRIHRWISAHLHRSEFRPDRDDHADGSAEVHPIVGKGKAWRYIRACCTS